MFDKTFFVLGVTLVTIFAIIALFPIYWMIKGGFEDVKGAMKVPPNFVLKSLDLLNYETIFTRHSIFRWIANSLIVGVCSTLLVVFSSLMSGYAFAKKEFPGKSFLFWLMLFTLMIPFQVTLIPRFLTVKSLGMINTHWGIFLPISCGVGAMFLSRQYMSTIPSELIDSAYIDGASEVRIFLSIILPLSKPLIAALSIFSFVGAWNQFLWPLVITTSNEMRTLPIAIACISSMAGELTDIGLAMAGATLIAIPMYAIFFSFQKYFTKGITLGAIKG